MVDTEILQALREHVQTTESGTVTIVFENNSIGRIYLDAGKPALAKYKGQEGLAALEACRGLAIRTAKFHAGVNIVGSKMSLDSPVPQAPAPPPAEPRRVQPTPAPPPSLTPDQRRVIGQILAEHVGPASTLIISELPDDAGLDAALNLLVREIGDAQQAKQFVMQVRRALH